MAKKSKVNDNNLDYYIKRGQYLIDSYADRNTFFEGVDEMIRMEWDLPEELATTGWVSKEVAPDMRQSYEGAKRILEDNEPRITIKPYAPEPEARKLADSHERGCQWLLKSASRRKKATIVGDSVGSMIRYGAMAAQVIFVPEQIKSVKGARGKLREQNAARRGPFIVKMYNPKYVFPRMSDFGIEEIFVQQDMDPNEIYDNYGEYAKGMWDHVQANNMSSAERINLVTFNDYLSWDRHVVWVKAGGENFEIINDEWKWPFIPWIYKIVGSSIEDEQEHEYEGLLYDAYHSDLFDLMCRVRSLRVSEMLRYAGMAKMWFQSDIRKQPDIDAGSAELTAHIEEEEKIGTLQPPQPDTGMAILDSELKQSHQVSTLSHILLGGAESALGGRTAFASINLVTHSALQVLKQPKAGAEEGLAEIVEIMLLWIHYAQHDVEAWSVNKRTGEVKPVTIGWKDVKPNALYIGLNLEADVPTDRQARAATAGAMIDRGVIARRTAMEDVGVRDTEDEENLILQERLMDNQLQIYQENERMLASQAIRQQIIAEFIQQQAAQAQAAQAPEGAPPGITSPGTTMPNQIMQPGLEGVPGEMLNPAMGGAIPAEFSPEMTREMQTRTTATGEEVAEI